MSESSEFNAPPVNPVHSEEYQGRGVFVDEDSPRRVIDFARMVNEAAIKTSVRANDTHVELNDAVLWLRHHCRETHKSGHKIIFIGNGGSSAIASHMATDFSKNGGIRAIAFNDAPLLTCLANDFGSEHIFSKQLEYYAQKGDMVIIVSSSGRSPNILMAAEQAFRMGLTLITFSGMNADNVLRRKGIVSFWVPATDYGIVELAHLVLLHSVVSITAP